MPDIADGETAEVKGSAAKPYVLKNTGGVYSCSCPAWRNQSAPIERRTCKHLRKYRGEAAEKERCGGELPARAKKSEKKDGPPILLAHAWDNSTDLKDWWMSEKLDGVRAYWDGKRFVSRQGNEYLAPDWFIDGLPDTPLDGELWIDRKKFQRTVSVVRRQDRSEHWKEVKYLVFDAPGQSGDFEERMGYLEETLRQDALPYADFHRHQRCKGLPHLQTELERVEGLGGEGLMLREPGSAYEVGRSSSLLKVKTFHDAEAEVLAIQPGKGKHKGKMGAVSVKLPDGTEFSVGTGFSDAQRAAPPEVGSLITFRYQELSDGGVPRFPSFVRMHESNGPAKKGASKVTAKKGAKKTVTKKATPAKAKGSAKKTPAVVTDDSGEKRYFELVDDKSSKFWEISVNENLVTVRYGRIGTDGTTKVKELGDESKALAHGEKLVGEKTKKGYEEK